MIYSFSNELFSISSWPNGIVNVYKSIGSNAYVKIISYYNSQNRGDHMTSIGTIVIWTVRS